MCHGMNPMARLKKMVSLALDPQLLARLEAWLKEQELPTTKTAVMELALREFLDARERKK
jgi:hypothetical protein